MFVPDEGCNPTIARWYALKVRTRSEVSASNAVRGRGYDALLPVRTERRKYSDRIKPVETAIFPGYLFCKFAIANKSPVLTCPAVEYIVTVGGIPRALKESEIDAIRRTVEAGGRPAPYLTVGQRVRVEYGSLAGVEGILTRKDSRHELTLSVDLLQRSICVRINPAHVRPLSEPQQALPIYAAKRTSAGEAG
jgi:transcription antitermination factor NusG